MWVELEDLLARVEATSDSSGSSLDVHDSVPRTGLIEDHYRGEDNHDGGSSVYEREDLSDGVSYQGYDFDAG